MKKNILISFILTLLLVSCAQEYNQVYKSTDYSYKYEYAKECFVRGKYSSAVPLLQDLVTIQKGTDNAQECLYMLAMAEYGLHDYEAASEAFKKYYHLSDDNMLVNLPQDDHYCTVSRRDTPYYYGAQTCDVVMMGR